MRKLLAVPLLGLSLLAADALLPAPAAASGWNQTGRCGPIARFFGRCTSSSSFSFTRGVQTDPAVPEPGAAALFALGAAVIAARSRRRAR